MPSDVPVRPYARPSANLSQGMDRPRVAVLGASGIGRFHVRELLRAGAEVVAILGRTEATARTTAEALRTRYGLHAQPLHRFEDLLELALDAVSIATPHELHFEHALACLRAGLFVSCEKPLFWEDGLRATEVEERLARLERAGADERLALNVSNASFLTTVAEGVGRPQELHCSFHTRGPHRGRAIGVDLLPHGLSLAHAWLGVAGARLVPEAVEATVEAGAYRCRFHLGELAVSFDFREDPQGEKAFAFALNGERFERVQREDATGYRVFLRDTRGEEREVVDPFRLYFERFTSLVRDARAPLGEWATAAAIQRSMTAILAV